MTFCHFYFILIININMIKKYIINKFTVYMMCFLLLAMFCLFPVKDVVLEEKIYNKEYVVYLLDGDNYLSKVTYFYDELTLEKEIENKICSLINGVESYDIFFPLIPKNTKINDIKIDKDSIYINFSSDILDINEYMKESMLESIVYTLTEINGINNIYLYVESKELFSDDITYPLTRSYGINKEYDIKNFNNINKTTIVFSKIEDDIKYNVPITLVSNDNNDKINIIIEELKSSIYSQNNLNGFINDKLELIDYDIDGDKMELVFNEYIFNNNDENYIVDDVKNVLSESIFENYDVNFVVLNTKNKKNIVKIEEST